MTQDTDITQDASRVAQSTEIRAALKAKKTVVGVDDVISALQKDAVSKVFLSNNTSQKVKERVTYYAELTGTRVNVFPGNSYDLGVVCKKPFMVSALAVKK
ncbi:50S ribosomal protein L30e [archaeon CG10_big_fil_rev_8_21_14_0_10_43_11]|nr:MAG: 50S ribosomal protein L30e [archaeon CG10_big_fil_rev_8_21_14_0_10_43_11]